MVKLILGLDAEPATSHEADAFAVASAIPSALRS
jgi:Holliday junction resolvasome RuvABC endonuclease subunit